MGILNPDGKTITTNGREAVTNDPKGEKYPWVPPTAAEKAKATLDTLGPEAMAKVGSKAIGIYFSAHWCPPCRGFTPKLAEMYKDAFEAKGMAIVFVSSDKDEGAFKEYFGEMPWFACPYAARDRKEALSKKFKVQGIPSFVILDPEGKTITTDGRSASCPRTRTRGRPLCPG